MGMVMALCRKTVGGVPRKSAEKQAMRLMGKARVLVWVGDGIGLVSPRCCKASFE